MPSTARDTGFEDVSIPPRVGPLICAQLRDRGIVTIDHLGSRSAVRGYAHRVMTLWKHPDSDKDRLTTIRDSGSRADRAGQAGFGRGELAPHTERSGIPRPPRLMMLVCLRKADAGGEVLLTDGQAVHEHLSRSAPEALEYMRRPGTAFYGGGGGHASQIFTPLLSSRVSLHLRRDQLAQFSPLIQRFLPALDEAIAAHQRAFLLEPGQGYIVDNHRYLHARAAFEGHRECVRALGEPRFSLLPGFSVGGCRLSARLGIEPVSCRSAQTAKAAGRKFPARTPQGVAR
ncbi:TauD/TfdA family dioxygenase [Streptomyces sp. NPDC098077]|uniref:TauD/TfdA family dioxygenase n=1 Tax=Streptomyces sp. NPDC098077 TaxID=3366093 RepID=UPI003828EB30